MANESLNHTTLPARSRPHAGAPTCCIREASPDGVVPLARLFRQEVELHQRLAGYYDLQPDFDWIAFVQRNMAQRRRTIFIAEQEGHLRGFIAVRLSGYARPWWPIALLQRLCRSLVIQPALPLKPLAWGVIDECFVEAASRRQGIGEALVARALQWCAAHGMQRVELGVLANNVGAVQFWEKLGFQTFRVLMDTRITSLER